MNDLENDFHLIQQLAEIPLPPAGLIQNIVALDSVTSTNDYAKQFIRSHLQPAGTVIIADEQSSGRGRFDRRWHSPPGTGLWFSVILKPEVNQQEWFAYSFLAALVTAGALESVCGILTDLKWPNDVMVSGKKCCGILIETLWNNEQPFIVIGAGINVNQTRFPDELKSAATSLRIESKNKFQRQNILLQWINRINEYRKFHSQDVIREWKRHSSMPGKTVTIQESESIYDAVVLDVAEDGALIVSVGGMSRSIYAGDIKLKICEE